MKQSAKKLCSLLVVLCLLVGLVPFSAFATESSDSGVEILYQQLVLGDDLTMKFEIAIEESVAEMAEVKLSVGGSETVYTVSELTPNENGNYLVSVDVAAAQMTDTITVTVAVGEFEIASKDYTVLAYAQQILNGNYGSATKALVKEMLNYGAKAQTYFDYQAGSLAEYENVTPATMPTEAEAMSVEGSVEGIKFYGSSMLFTGKLAIRYYFTAPNGVEGYTFTDANGNSYEADIKNSMYYVDVAGINPQDIDESVVLTVSDESSSLSVGYGPMNYITRMYNGNGSDNLKNLLQALYGYYLAAEAFVESGETQEEIGELAIPEGARMICDYSEAITPHIPDSWGSGSAAGYYNSYEAFEGRAGVYGMGAAAGTNYMWYNAVGLNDMDLSLAETITFRLMVKSGVRSLQIKHDDTEGIDILQDVTAFDEWIELTYNVADLGWSNLSKASVQFRFANPVDAGESEWIWLDQVYVMEREVTELAIPEGARMICDYSETVTPHIPDSWGTGPSGGYYNSYDKKDGRAGVFGFGANGECFMWYNAIGLNDMDLTLAETITFRMKVDSRIRNLNIKHDDIEEFNLYQYITVFDEWTEVTVNVADLGYSDLSKASIQFQFATWNNGNVEYVLLDQVYITERAVTELAIPEGAKLICDYSETITPHIPDSWGSGPSGGYYNSYDVKDGRAGVFGFGANGECFMWYNAIGLNDMDLSLAETITFRMKVDSRIRNLNIKHDDIEEFNLYQHITVFDEWTEVTVNVADLGYSDLSKASIQFQFATWNNGETEYVLLDQVYITEREVSELAIPEGATLICDYSSTISPYIPDSWGSGSAGGYYNSYDVKDGRAGVFGFGANGECFMWYTGVGLDGMDLSNAETITFRMKVDNRIRNLNIKHDNIEEYNLYQYITVFDEWTEVTVNVADLNFADLSNASIQFQFATWNNGETEYVLLDQVYMTLKEEEELDVPTVIPTYEQNREEKQLEVMAFWMPPIEETQYQWMQEAGVTSLLIDNQYSGNYGGAETSQIFTLCDQYGIDAYLVIPRGSHDGEYAASFDLDMDHPSFKGFFIDEPITKTHLDNVISIANYAASVGKVLNVNLLSEYADDYSWVYETDEEYQAAVAAGEFFADYDAYISYAMEGLAAAGSYVKLSTCVYPLMATDKDYSATVQENWLELLAMIQEQASAIGAESVPFINITAYHSGGGNNYHRQPTESDIRWQYYAALAYGATGIQNFTWTTTGGTVEFDETDHGAIGFTDQTDTSTYYRTDVYYSVQNVTDEISKLDQALLSFNWQGVMVNAVGSNAATTAALNNAGSILSENRRISSISSTKDLLVGCFLDTNNYDGFLLVNFDETANGNTAVNTVSVTFKQAITAVVYVKGERQIVTLTDGVYTCELLPGEAVFVIPVNGSTEAELVELAIPENALMVENFASSENYQGVAGVKALSDGTYTDLVATDFDFSGYNNITFRVKAASGASVTVGGQAMKINGTGWNDVTVKLSALSGTEVAVSGNVWIDQIFVQYIPEELAIPEGALMVCDYSVAVSPFNSPDWGTGAVGASAWCDAYDGRAGVQAFGLDETDEYVYTQWGGLLPDVDLSEYSHLVFRMKVNKSALRVMSLYGEAEYDILSLVDESNAWVEVTVKITDLTGTILRIANTEGADGEIIWMDQVYAIKSTPELEIPEGAALITDFSEAVTPNTPSSWGCGPDHAYSNNYAEYNGRAGVFALGAKASCFMWYTGVGMEDMNLSNYTHITFRMMVRGDLRTLDLLYNGGESSISLLDHVTVRDEWTEVTLCLSDLGIANLSDVDFQFKFATWDNGSVDYVWFDQLYATCQELAIPEGATLICDYSSAISPYIPDSWGSGSAGGYYNSHDEKDGRAGVFGFGANGECFMWYTGVGLDGMDLSNATHITFRMKVDSRIRNLNIKHDNISEYNLYQHITEFDKWTEVTIPIADLNFADLSNASIQFQFATWNNGEVEYVMLDQVYVTCQELAIPEGATLICDYSEAITPSTPTSWGCGPDHAYYNNYAEKDGRSGVLGLGATGECFMWHTNIGMEGIDVSNATTITFRIKVDSRIRSLNFTQHNTNDYDLYSRITEFDKWIDVTINIADLNFSNPADAVLQLQFATWDNGACEYVWLDQVYIQ